MTVPITLTRSKTTIAADKITLHPDFVTRQGDLDAFHLRTLTAAIKAKGPLSRVLLWRDVQNPTGPLVLLDGRYRLWAYAGARWTQGIPAVVITCARKDAMLAATEDAIKDRKNLDPREKADRAWRLVRDAVAIFSKAEISRATGIGSATVGRMRARWRDMVACKLEASGFWWRDAQDSGGDEQPERTELTDAQRKRIVKRASVGIRDALDWRKWTPAIPDDEAQFEAIADAIGLKKLRKLLDWCLGSDPEMIDAWRCAMQEGSDEVDAQDDTEPNF